MGGQVGIADNLKIGNNSILAGKTGVSANVLPKKFMMGNPAMEMKKILLHIWLLEDFQNYKQKSTIK